MSEFATVLDYGADANGRDNSAAAFQAMADDDNISTIIVPNGDFVIGNTVNLRGKSMVGIAKNKNGGASRVRPTSGIGEPMFTNQGAIVSDLHVYGTGERNGITIFDANSYSCSFENIRFDQVGTAIRMEEIGVNFSVVGCRFIQSGTGVHCLDVNNDVSTTCRFVRNEFNNVGNAIVFEKDLKGSTFVCNIFEYMSGDAIVAALLYDCNFIGNWWERRRPEGDINTQSPVGNYETDGDYPCVRVLKSQQFMRCFSAANTVTWGWRNMFSTDSHVSTMGGVSTDTGDIVVRDPTGRGLRISDSAIERESAQWAGLGPLVFDAGYNDTGRPGMSLRTRGGPLILEDNEGESFTGSIRLGKDDGLVENLHPAFNLRYERIVGMIGKSQVDVNGETQTGLSGVPQYFRWSQDGLAKGLDALEESGEYETGTVRLRWPYVIDNPIVQVSVEDQGVYYNGLSHHEEYVNGSSTRRQCRGVYLYFVDSEGNPVTPSAFACTMLAVPPSID